MIMTDTLPDYTKWMSNICYCLPCCRNTNYNNLTIIFKDYHARFKYLGMYISGDKNNWDDWKHLDN